MKKIVKKAPAHSSQSVVRPVRDDELPSVPKTERTEPAAKPVFPEIESGGWRDVLAMQRPEFTVFEVPCGAFLWLWDLVENKASMIERAENAALGSPHNAAWRENYAVAVFGARDALRSAATQHYAVRQIGIDKRAAESGAAETKKPKADVAATPAGKKTPGAVAPTKKRVVVKKKPK